jgi:golgi phosphoprotein 3
MGADEDDKPARNGSSPSGSTTPRTGISHAGSAFEGGSKIAFDPRDLEDVGAEERKVGGKVPRLTIMEEILLLGIKDKQVSGLLTIHS